MNLIYLNMIMLIVLIVTIMYLFLLKKDIKNLVKQLHIINNNDTNIKLYTLSFDKDICNLIDLTNDVLNKNTKIFNKQKKIEKDLQKAITNISHDLRTPLTSALGYLNMIKSSNFSDDRKLIYLDIIEKKLNFTSTIIYSLFEFSQYIEGHFNVNLKKTNIANILRNSITFFYNDFIEKSFNIKINITNKPICIITDEFILERIFHNLIQNALNHGSNDFYVELVGDKEIVFSNKIENTKKIDINNIFDRFYKTTGLTNNTGLGLSIVKILINELGFKISAYIEKDILSIKVWIK